MTQLPLFPQDADDLLAAIRRQRRALWRGERGGAPLDMAALGGSAPGTPGAPQAGFKDGPVGVLGWPKAAPGDPAWEAFGFVLVDIPRWKRAYLATEPGWRG